MSHQSSRSLLLFLLLCIFQAPHLIAADCSISFPETMEVLFFCGSTEDIEVKVNNVTGLRFVLSCGQLDAETLYGDPVDMPPEFNMQNEIEEGAYHFEPIFPMSSDGTLSIAKSAFAGFFRRPLPGPSGLIPCETSYYAYLIAVSSDDEDCLSSKPIAELRIEFLENLPQEHTFTVCEEAGELTINLKDFQDSVIPDKLSDISDLVFVKWYTNSLRSSCLNETEVSLVNSPATFYYSLNSQEDENCPDRPEYCSSIPKKVTFEISPAPTFKEDLEDPLIFYGCPSPTGHATFNIKQFSEELSDLVCENCDNSTRSLKFFELLADGSFKDISAEEEYQASTLTNIKIQIVDSQDDNCSSGLKDAKLEVLDITNFLQTSASKCTNPAEFNLRELEKNDGTDGVEFEILWFTDEEFENPIADNELSKYEIDQSTTIYAKLEFSFKYSIGQESVELNSTCNLSSPVTLNLTDVPDRTVDVLGASILEIASGRPDCSNTENILVTTNESLEGFTYEWQLSNNLSISDNSKDQSSSVLVNLSGNSGTVTLKVNDGCTEREFKQKIESVDASLEALSPPSIIFQNGALIVTDAACDSYQWGFTDKTDIFFVKDNIVEGAIFQDLVVGDDPKDQEAIEYWVEVQKEECVVRSYYDDFITNIIPTIDDQGHIFEVFPNPSNGAFQIYASSSQMGQYQLSIFNSVGQQVHTVVLQKNMDQQLFSIDQKILPKGLYFVKITTEHQASTVLTQGIIVQ